MAVEHIVHVLFFFVALGGIFAFLLYSLKSFGLGDGKFVIAIWEKYCDLPVAWRFGIVLVGMSAVGLVLWLTEPAT